MKIAALEEGLVIGNLKATHESMQELMKLGPYSSSIRQKMSSAFGAAALTVLVKLGGVQAQGAVEGVALVVVQVHCDVYRQAKKS